MEEISTRNELAENLLYPGPNRLDNLLTEKFNEHASFKHLHTNYVVNFLMGLASMLMTEEVKAKYGVRRVFFINFGQKDTARMVILTENSSPDKTKVTKSMKVRSFDVKGKGTPYSMVLSTQEYQVMKQLLNEQNVGHEGEGSNIMERINLDEYDRDYAAYQVDVEQIHRTDSPNAPSSIKLNFKEYFDPSKLKKQILDRSKIPSASEFLLDHEVEFDSSIPSNKILLITDKQVITPEMSREFDSNAMLTSYKDYYASNGRASLENFKHMFTGSNSIADMFRKLSSLKGPSAECGFTHGLLFFLSYKYPSYIELHQKINSLRYEPGTEKTYESSETFLIHKPRFAGTKHSALQIPMVCVFSEETTTVLRRDLEYIPSSLSTSGYVGCIGVELESETTTSILRKIEKRPDLVNDLFDYVHKDYSYQHELEFKIRTRLLHKVRDPLREYKTSERNYLSRYLASWAMLTENKDVTSYALLSKAGEPKSTRILLQLNKVEPKTTKDVQNKQIEDDGYEEIEDDGYEQIEEERPEQIRNEHPAEVQETKPPSNILLVIQEEPMSETHFPSKVLLEEPYAKFEGLQEEDTLIINVRQDYVHSTQDYLVTDTAPQQDHTEFVITFSFAKSEDVLRSHEAYTMPQLPHSSLINLLEGKTNREAPQLKQLLKFGRYFARNPKDYEAFLDGIFLDNQCMKIKPEGKGEQSDVSYIRRSESTGEITRVYFSEKSLEMTIEPTAEGTSSNAQEYERMKITLTGNTEQMAVDSQSRPSNAQIPKPTDEETRLDPEERQVQIIRDAETSELNVRFLNRPSEQTNVESSDLPVRNFQTMSIEQDVMTPGSYKSLEKISKISRYLMLGLMIRDAYSDGVKKHYGALAKDIGFILLTTSSPLLSPMASLAGKNLIRSGSKFAGYAMKGLGFGLKRAISLYVIYDLVENAVKYAKNTNDTDAKLSMEIDAAFVAIDVLTIAAEAMGVGAVFGPIGEVAGALLILGLNVYQTVKTLQQIEKIVPLKAGEVIDESIRAFLHIDIDEYIRELMDEKVANTKLFNEAIDYLRSQNHTDTYITASAEIHNNQITIHGDTIIDMRESSLQRISRASPGISKSENLHHGNMACYLHEQQIEIEHEPGFWETFTGFFLKLSTDIRSLDLIMHKNYSESLKAAFDCQECIVKNTPNCYNAFGVSMHISKDKAALFKLGNKSDLVWGYSDKRNTFVMAGGVKNVTGGVRDDTFVIGSGPITGLLNGSFGTDILDLSSFTPEELTISGTFLRYKMGSLNSSLQFHSIETIIVPATSHVGSPIIFSSISGIRRVVSTGDLHIEVRENNVAESTGLVLEFSGAANVENTAQTGPITYIIKRDRNSVTKNSSLFITNTKLTNHTIIIMENLYDIESVVHQDDRSYVFHGINGRIISLFLPENSLNNTQIMFGDGSTFMPSGKSLIHATLATELHIREIESKYTGAVERLGIIMVAYSTTDKESITISHGMLKASNSTLTSQVLQNSADHSTHMVLNGGQYLILINPNAQGQLEKTTIRSKNVKNLTKIAIDLNAVIEFYTREESLFIGAHGHLTDQNDIEIYLTLHVSDDVVLSLGKIIVEDILSDDFYRKVHIRNYGEYIINSSKLIRSSSNHRFDNTNTGHTVLTPSPIQFPSNVDIIILTPYNVEPFNQIIVNIDAGELNHYSINATTLVLSNFPRNYQNEQGNIITIFFESFYSVKKMGTLHLVVGGKEIDMGLYKNVAAPDFSSFWKDLETKQKSG